MDNFSKKIQKLIDQDDTEKLIELLSDKKGEIRLSAFLALSEKEDDKIIVELKKHLTDEDPQVQAVATLKFGDFTAEPTMDNLKQIILSGTQNNKIEALKLLANRDLEKHPEINILLGLATKDKNILVRKQAIAAMGELKDKFFMKYLIESLNDEHPSIRLSAVEALGNIGDEESESALLKALVDKNDEVNSAALKGLNKTGRRDILDDAPLIMHIENMSASKGKRLETIQEISIRKITDGHLILMMACSDEYKDVRLAGVRALGELKDKRTVSKIIELLDDEYHDIRLEAIKALDGILKPSEKDCLKKVIEDNNKQVKEEAIKLYESLS